MMPLRETRNGEKPLDFAIALDFADQLKLIECHFSIQDFSRSHLASAIIDHMLKNRVAVTKFVMICADAV